MTGLFNLRFFRVYVVPGAVFQSVMVGGGYGTGREIIEYFTAYGFVGGLLALLVALVCLSLTLMLTFEFSRLFRVYEYRSFFKLLLGRGWVAFEVLIILQFLLVLAVLASAAGNILRDTFAMPYMSGLLIMLVAVGMLTYFGRDLVARALTTWSFVLYGVFAAFFITVFTNDRHTIGGVFEHAEVLSGWWRSGLQYALYNIAAAPLLLYVARSFETRAEAVSSGLIAGFVALIPALMLHVAFFAVYPEILQQSVPVYWMMSELGMSVLLLLYSVMLFGTFIETGAGMLQGINERIDAYLSENRGKGLTRAAHAGLSVSAILVSATFALWGITRLIAEGYGTMAWGFLAVYAIPLLTIGFRRITTANP